MDVVSKLAEGGINVVNLYPSDRRNPSNVHRQLQMKGYEHFFPLLAVEGILSDMFAKGDAADTITQTLQSLEEKVSGWHYHKLTYTRIFTSCTRCCSHFARLFCVVVFASISWLMCLG